jgi:predicted transcriptional regulator
MEENNGMVMLSIKPEYVKKIFEGSKAVELRKNRPKKLDGVLVYETFPASAVVGFFKVDRVEETYVEQLWHLTKGMSGVRKMDFDLYYMGRGTGVGIFFNPKNVIKFKNPVRLKTMRTNGFNPPQSFRYVTRKEFRFYEAKGCSELSHCCEILPGAQNE